MLDLSKLVKVETEADYKAESERSRAVEYLKQTDWYVIRHVETGQEVPEEIKKKRAEARDKVAR